MNVPVIKVEESEEINEKARQIYVNYTKLMLKCMEDEGVCQDFQDNPHRYLNTEVGMTIPEKVGVVLDAQERWPILYVKTPEGDKIAVREGNLGLDLIADMVNGTHEEKNVKLVDQAKIDVRFHSSLEKCEAVVVLPFLDAKSDILGEYRFDDGDEIILTSA